MSEPRLTDESRSGISLRAMLVGTLLCGVIAVGLPYGEFVLNGTQMGLNSSTPAAFFMLFLLVALVQPLLGFLRRDWLFSRAELLSITVMMMITTAIAARGFISIAVPIMTGVFYFASPENNWEELLIPHVPTWLIPYNPQAIKDFYEGLPEGEAIPWGVWIEPLFWWFLFMTAFYLVIVCSMVIVRRQWMDHERLLYPLTQVPLGMVEDGDRPSQIKPFLKNPTMWIGLAVPLVLHGINALSHYYEFIGRINFSYSLPLVQDTVRFYLRFDCMWIGLAYLVNTNITFSLWLFYMLVKVQEVAFTRIGILSTETLDIFSHTFDGPTMGILSHQTMGAMIVMVLLGLWTARSHLWDVLQHLWRREGRSDGDELLSYRTALIGIVLGLAFMSVWLWRSGLPLWAVFVYLFGAFVIFLALTRVIVEAGLAAAVQGMSGCGFLISSVGSSSIGVAGVLATGVTLAWAGDLLVFMMAPCANGIRMLHGLGRYKRRILVMMGLAMAIGLVGGVYTILVLSYHYGANNFHGSWAWFAKEPFRVAQTFALNPVGPNWEGWLWNVVGAGVMTLLIWARHHLLWWPFHPIGYLVSGTWILNSVWFSIFLAWLIKALVLRYMGPNGYKATRWFFLGMVLGQFVAGGVWMVIDGFTGMTGNRIRMF
jgi:hypothetical protein